MRWPPSLADYVAAATVLLAIGSAVMNAVHGYFARQRMFDHINGLQKKVRVLWGIAIAEGKIKPTITGFEDDEV